ncbi:hypothetical protein [Dorea longicatena]|uniref:hypothetical protein n=1 Tax=Dorea longicatena TaxID=88431 RepID=UPI003569BFF4
MTNKLTLTEQEELFAKDCKLINLKYEYNGYTGDEKWAIITELSVKELWEKYPLVIERYSPFVHLSIAQGEVIDDANRNEDKYAKRSSRTLAYYKSPSLQPYCNKKRNSLLDFGMLPSYRTMKYKSPIWGYFHVQKE